MTPVEAKRAVLLREWSLMVQRHQESGLTISEWCRQNGITESCYYHRLRRVRNSILERSSLMPKANRTLLEAPTIVKVDTSLPMEQSPAPELPSTTEQPDRQPFRLQYNGAVLDIPVGTVAEDISEVLKAVARYAI